MLRKFPTRQNEGEPHRQWLADDYFDLYVWYNPDGTIYGFQLCYDKRGNQRALTWLSTGEFRHNRVDAGDSTPQDNRSPILTDSCPFQREPVLTEFTQRSSDLEPHLRTLILEKLTAYPSSA